MDPKVRKTPVKPARPHRGRVSEGATPVAKAVSAAAPDRASPKDVMPPVATAALATPAVVGAAAAAAESPPFEPTGDKPAPVPAPAPVMPASLPHAQFEQPAPEIAVPPLAAAAPIIQPAAKEIIMETIENVTAKTQTAFNEATAQAKGAVEKGQKMFEDANEFGKGNIEALVEASKVAVRGIEAMSQDAAAFAKKSFEEATTVAKTLSTVKSPTELMKLQADYVRSAFDAMVQQTSRNTEAMLKLAGEVAQPLSNRVALAAEKLKVAA